MSKYESSAELSWKADSEGGFTELAFGYGLRTEDLPDDMPTHIRAFIRQILAVEPAVNAVEQYLEKAVIDYVEAHPEEF